MVDKNNSHPSRRGKSGGATHPTLSTAWLTPWLQTVGPLRDLAEQWLAMASVAMPMMSEYQRAWETWARYALAGAPGMGAGSGWAPWAGSSETPPADRDRKSSSSDLDESLADLRRQVSSLRAELQRYRERDAQ